MTPENASATLEFLCGTLTNEIKTTRCILAAVPDDKADYTPHPTSMTALALAIHLATADVWFADGIVKGAFAAHDEKMTEKFKKPSDVVAFYDETMPSLLDQLKAISGEKIAQPLSMGSWTMPGLNFLNIMLLHSSHHRGQLSTYLRPMGAKVPAIYGGSADSTADAASA
jgi:uncharacterized damage-inducible protein DinB